MGNTSSTSITVYYILSTIGIYIIAAVLIPILYYIIHDDAALKATMEATAVDMKESSTAATAATTAATVATTTAATAATAAATAATVATTAATAATTAATAATTELLLQ